MSRREEIICHLTERKRIVALDWGSTSVRLVICYLSNLRLKELYNPEALTTQDGSRYEKGAFNGYINTSGTGRVYTGDELSPSTTQVSAKFFLGNGRGIDGENPLRAEAVRNINNPNFEDRGKEGVAAILTAVFQRLESECQKKSMPLKIVDFGLSVPAHWTLEEHEKYAELVREKSNLLSFWSFQFDRVHFHTEVEAIAHYVCQDSDVADRILGSDESQYVLFLDFGGHSMLINMLGKNGCIFFVRRSNDKTAFFRVDEPFGKVGGTAMWEADVSEFCVEHTKSNKGNLDSAHVTQLLRNAILKEFRWQLMANTFSEGATSWALNLTIRRPKDYPSDSQHFHVDIPALKTFEIFRAALKGPFQEAEQGIREIARLIKSRTGVGGRVVVSGGSAKNQFVKECLKATVQTVFNSAKLPCPIFLDEISMSESPYESFNIAKGAALATAKNQRIQEYIKDGAAFGIQVMRGRGGGGDEEWDHFAKVVLANAGEGWRRSRYHSFETDGTNRFKIVCDPFWDTESHPRRRTWLDCGVTYDFLDLLIPPEGKWQFRLTLPAEQNPMYECLILERHMVHGGQVLWPTHQKVELRTSFDRSGMTFLVQPDRELEDLHCGIGLTPLGTYVALTPLVEREWASEVSRRMAITQQQDEDEVEVPSGVNWLSPFAKPLIELDSDSDGS
ncbi:hypothetical protein BDP55DRAFT_752377 [Colletotrichum godetiae]|uniref:Uncharacterized protein n=1 Tax=Colletotrichum godetiae TaxID=1209918 RepID=A0AAJ0ADD8_9PEZI|nr:uncharacterized protein BDP55DRAFT_752377 [Colletotrichum godetiae]KAK1671757.1 hypothetical protein BDP55DRAFT_752377 [Colletotrichum godetiae]